MGNAVRWWESFFEVRFGRTRRPNADVAMALFTLGVRGAKRGRHVAILFAVLGEMGHRLRKMIRI